MLNINGPPDHLCCHSWPSQNINGPGGQTINSAHECFPGDYSLQFVHRTAYRKITNTESFESIYGLRDFKMHINYVAR